jgi:hypothetical protein
MDGFFKWRHSTLSALLFPRATQEKPSASKQNNRNKKKKKVETEIICPLVVVDTGIRPPRLFN